MAWPALFVWWRAAAKGKGILHEALSSAWLRGQHQAMLCPSGMGFVLVLLLSSLLMLFLMFPLKSSLQSSPGLAVPFQRWQRELERGTAARGGRDLGWETCSDSFIYKYQLFMAQSALQLILTHVIQEIQLFPVCFAHIKPAHPKAFPGQFLRLGRACSTNLSSYTWVNPGRKLLSVTVFVLEKPRCQMGRQNVVTLKISPTYSTPQVHQALKSVCAVSVAVVNAGRVRFSTSELSELQIILSSTNGRSFKLFMRDIAFIYNTEGISRAAFCLKTTKTLHLKVAASS